MGELRYEVTAMFDDGLFKIVDSEWVQIGPPNPPCRCLYCLTSGRRPSRPLSPSDGASSRPLRETRAEPLPTRSGTGSA